MDIFNRALDLCALRGGNDTLPDDLEDLKRRCLGLLNVLLGEVRPLQERLTGKKQPIRELYGLEETVDLHGGLATGYVPFALASLLIADEDRELSDLLMTYARQAKQDVMRDGCSRRHGIVEVYG